MDAKKLSSDQSKQLTQLALEYYPASVKAVLGLVLETLGKQKAAASLKATLNPLSKYNLGLDGPLTKQWNIR